MRKYGFLMAGALIALAVLAGGCGGGGGSGSYQLPANPSPSEPTDPPSTLPTVTIAAADDSAAESATGAESGLIRISRTGATTDALPISVAISGTVSNLSGVDFDQAPLADVLEIPAGSDSVDIAVDPIDDSEVEGREFLMVTLVANAAIYDLDTTTEATVDLYDDDTIVENIDVDEAENRITANQGDPLFQIIDVRTPAEYAGGHLADSININYYDADFGDQLDALDPAGTYLVHCQSGARSAPARDQMAQKNIRVVWNMLGGMNAWVSAGKPVSTD